MNPNIIQAYIKNELKGSSISHIRKVLRDAVGRLVDGKRDGGGVHLSVSEVADVARAKAKSLEEKAQELRDDADRAERIQAGSEED